AAYEALEAASEKLTKKSVTVTGQVVQTTTQQSTQTVQQSTENSEESQMTTSPKTGDNAPLAMMVIICMAGIAVTTVAVLLRKRRRS
ncbi:MAG: LPXTG cell wall anchor domain-containing protein, partial [Roseburia sp.]|nr:LPXTG cell wall anchor domain-containing protein [Roseburia sp.]